MRTSTSSTNMMERNLNYTFDRPDSRDHRLKTVYKTPTDAALLPDVTDLTDQLGEVLDQGSLGSCTVQTLSAQLTYLALQHFGELYYSRLFAYFQGRLLAHYPLNKDTGLTMRQAVKGVAQGIILESDWPYDVKNFSRAAPVTVSAHARKCVTYLAVDQTLPELRRCLIKNPISFGMTLRNSFLSKEVEATGNVPLPKGSSDHIAGGHAMLLTGYDANTKRFKVRNSWGRDWGVAGNCFIPEEMVLDTKMSGDFWIITGLTWQPEALAIVNDLERGGDQH